MRKDRLIGALALTGALAGGGIAGALFGVPGISGAQTATSTTTPSPTTPPEKGYDRGDCRFLPRPGLDAAAKALGISESDLHDQLRDGKTLADVAKAKGVDVQKVIDAMVADATERIDQAVKDGRLDADRAASLKDGLKDRITTFVNEGAKFEGPDVEGHRRFLPGPGLDAAAKALGISESDLRDQLRDAKTLADVAKAKGVDVQKVIDAMVADATERIDQAVKDGRLDADRAASLKDGLKDRITRLVNEGPKVGSPDFEGHRRFGPGPNGFPGGASGFAPRFGPPRLSGQFD